MLEEGGFVEQASFLRWTQGRPVIEQGRETAVRLGNSEVVGYLEHIAFHVDPIEVTTVGDPTPRFVRPQYSRAVVELLVHEQEP